MNESIFFRLLKEDDQEAVLRRCIADLREGHENDLTHLVRQETFALLPGFPMPYWVSDDMRRKFKELPPFEGNGDTVKQGLATADDFRFVRAWWEVAPGTIARSREETWQGKRWVPFAKGGEYSPYYDDVHLAVNWENDGEEIRNFERAVIRNENYYFQPGLTYPLATVKGYNVRLMAYGCIFGHKGPAIFLSGDDLKAIASSRVGSIQLTAM